LKIFKKLKINFSRSRFKYRTEPDRKINEREGRKVMLGTGLPLYGTYQQ
jgi:hypothetical protein